jgi:D-lactate dehydrogenase (cytochrome)
MKALAAEQINTLQVFFPRDAVVASSVELLTYETDGSLGIGHPQALVLARTTEQVVSAARWAHQNHISIIPRGAGTGLSGGALASQGGLVISFARMKQIVELDEVGRSAIIQPGLVHQTLDEFVKTKGLYYPPDPASGRSCTLGGNLAENAGGPHCFKYGVTTNYVTGLKAVLADGRVIVTGGRAFDYPEYDLTGLLVGSEGTLGILTEAYVRLIRNIPGVKTLMAIFDSVEQAGEAVSTVIARGLVPGTLEMMDRNMIGIVENYVHAGLPTDANALLIIEADGYPTSLDSQMAEIMQVMRECQARELRLAKTAAERDQIWFARKSAFGAIAQISPAYLIVDGTVPRSKLAATLGEINQICANQNLRVGYVFHAGDGNLHPLILFDPRDEEMVRRVHVAGQAVMELCVRQGGTITGEHGVGSEKVRYMSLMYNAAELQALQDIKDVFDPKNTLNPGKIIPTQEKTPLPHLSLDKRGDGEEIAPTCSEEAADALRAWNAQNPSPRVQVRGGGTKSKMLPPSDTRLSTRALRGLKAFARDDLYVTVGAGTPLAELQAELARDKVWVPIASPWRDSTIGGIVATNFNAPLRMRYGALRDLILAITTVLPDGRVIRAGKPVVKNVAGYDLPKLFIGAYGTLGVMTDVTFKLMPFPRARTTLVVPVANLNQGMKLGMRLLRVSLVASSLLLCKGCNLPNSASQFNIIFTAEGVPEDVQTELDEARAVIKSEGLAEIADGDLPTGSDLWAQWINAASQKNTLVRAGVPPKDLTGFLTGLETPLTSAELIVSFADGLTFIHSDHVAAIRQAAQAVKGYAVILSASEQSKDVWGHKPEGLDLMGALKARWDPRGILNPGVFAV